MKQFIKLALLCISLGIAISGCSALSSLMRSGGGADAGQRQTESSARFIFYDSYAKW